MTFVDRPLGFAWKRTPREIALLAVGVGFTIQEASSGRNADPFTIFVYVAATVAFAARFFPSRAIGAGVAIGAIAQRWWLGGSRGMPYDLDWTAYVPFAMLVLLASRDLVEKFDRAPSGISWFPNRWAALPEKEARVLRWCAYLAGALGGVLWRSWLIAHLHLLDAGVWPLAAIAALSLCVVLLAHGRAAVLVALPPLAGAIAWAVAPTAPLAFRAALPDDRMWMPLARLAEDPLPIAFRVTPALQINAALLAAALALLSLPYAIRLIRRSR